MATRNDVKKRRNSMEEALKQACLSRQLAPGEALAPLRELAAQYQVSRQVAWQSVKNLVEEGVLYTIPRVGTFVGPPPRSKDVKLYLLILPWFNEAPTYLTQIQMGFEERIAQLGGVALALAIYEVEALIGKGELPLLQGVLQATSLPLVSSPLVDKFESRGVPCVYFGNLAENAVGDAIHFNDEDGGVQATQHLLDMGHRRIGFLGLHSTPNETGAWQWSAEREAGWRKAMEAANLPTDLVYRPSKALNREHHQQRNAGYEGTLALMAQAPIDAIVVVGSIASEGLFAALQESQIPPQNWPAVVSFDEHPMSLGSVVSYLRLPWEQVGRGGAEMLHNRATGKVGGERQQRLVPMRLIPRLSCREQWTATPGLAKHLTTSSLIASSSLHDSSAPTISEAV